MRVSRACVPTTPSPTGSRGGGGGQAVGGECLAYRGRDLCRAADEGDQSVTGDDRGSDPVRLMLPSLPAESLLFEGRELVAVDAGAAGLDGVA